MADRHGLLAQATQCLLAAISSRMIAGVRSHPTRLVSLICQRKRETKTWRNARSTAGKAANQSNATRRAPQLLF